MKKYYINDKGFLLVDENNTSYLLQNGYREITQKEYDAMLEQQNEAEERKEYLKQVDYYRKLQEVEDAIKKE